MPPAASTIEVRPIPVVVEREEVIPVNSVSAPMSSTRSQVSRIVRNVPAVADLHADPDRWL